MAEDLAGSDLQSLLMEVYQQRAADIREPGLRHAAGRGLLAPCGVDARLLNAFDRIAFQTAEGFEALDLSPVCPFGLSRTLGEIDQNNILTTIRGAEVSGDPTEVLALECCRRRETAGATEVRLCASQRVVRLQPFDVPGYVPHFRLFCLVSAGRDTGSHTFELQHLGEHLRFYLRLFRALNAEGFRAADPLVEVADTSVTEALLVARGAPLDELRKEIRAHRPGGSERFLAERGIQLPEKFDASDPAARRLALVQSNVFGPLRKEFPEAEFRCDLARLEGLGYYRGLCMRISPAAPDGVRYPIVDGGFTDWTARLLQNKKERFLATGIGSQSACGRYRA